MRVVHISGSPGSGKSTLGRQLAGPAVAVKDTDEFFDDIPQSIWDSPRAWLAHVDAQVAAFVETHHDKRVIVFVGLLDSVWGGTHVFYEFSNATLFFLDVPVAQLLKQYYGRCATHMDWEQVASGERAIPSSQEKVREYHEDVREHTKRGYQLKSRNAIAAYVMQSERAFHPIYVRAGETFTFRYSTSAIRYPRLVLSDGLRILEDHVVSDDEKPGGSILREVSIIAGRPGRETVTLRARWYNGEEDEAQVTDVVVE
jgi:hypothetical protein